MTTFDPASGRHLPTTTDPDQELRIERLQALGLGEHPAPEFDAFAAELAQAAADLAGLPVTPYAMVNLFVPGMQYFTGLHNPTGSPRAEQAGLADRPRVGRTMSRDHGYCPDVVDRRSPLVLRDVCAWPRFASNEVVDRIGIRTYMGAPIFDDETGVVLGTYCVVDVEPRRWGREGLELMKHHGTRLAELIRSRADPS